MYVLFYLKSVTSLFYSIVPFPLSWYFKSLHVFIIDKSICYEKYITKAVDKEEINLMKQNNFTSMGFGSEFDVITIPNW